MRARLRRLRPGPGAHDATRPEGSSDQKIPKEINMRSILIVATGAIIFAAAMLTLAAAPGFLTERASTVPLRCYPRETGR
jgi:hypothetical protein